MLLRIKTLRSFLALCNVCGQIVHNFAHIAGPLNGMLRKETQKLFDDLILKQINAFEIVFEASTRAPTLHLPQPQQPYSINSEASAY